MSLRFLHLIFIFAFLSSVSAAGGRGPRGTRGRGVTINHRRTNEDDSSSSSSSNKTSDNKAPKDTTDSSGDSKGTDGGDVKKGKKGSKKAPKKRDCKIKEKSTRVEYKCKTNRDDTGGIEDEIGFQVDTSAGLKVNVQYRETIESNSSNTDTKTEYEIAFDRIIEYTKSKNRTSHKSEAYNWAKDNVVQEMQLMDWQSFSGVTNNTDGITSFDVASPDKTVMFTFKMATTDIGNMTANSMKIDFELINFPWMGNNSYVALISTVTSGRTVGVHEKTKNVDVSEVSVDFIDAVNTVGFTPFGAFTWATTADAKPVNGTHHQSSTIDVIATSAAPSRRRLMDNGTIETIAFSFVGDAAKGSSDIYWDPEAGIGYNTFGGSRLGIYLGAAAGVLALIILIVGAVILKRKRKQGRAVYGAKSPTSFKGDNGYPEFS